VPQAQADVQGLIDLRGQVLPILDDVEPPSPETAGTGVSALQGVAKLGDQLCCCSTGHHHHRLTPAAGQMYRGGACGTGAT
jgi:chemotaxis signal transduction protein